MLEKCARSDEAGQRRPFLFFRENEAQSPEPRPHDPRSELLEQIHLAGAMEQRVLFRLLDQRDLNHTWIGAQVGSEFLDMWHAADGKTFYRVTPRAVKELQLGQLASAATYASLSELCLRASQHQRNA